MDKACKVPPSVKSLHGLSLRSPSTSLCALLSVVPIIEAAARASALTPGATRVSAELFYHANNLDSFWRRRIRKEKHSQTATGDDKWILLARNIYFWGSQSYWAHIRSFSTHCLCHIGHNTLWYTFSSKLSLAPLMENESNYLLTISFPLKFLKL